MPISINNDGGSQYSYSFWLNKNSKGMRIELYYKRS